MATNLAEEYYVMPTSVSSFLVQFPGGFLAVSWQFPGGPVSWWLRCTQREFSQMELIPLKFKGSRYTVSPGGIR